MRNFILFIWSVLLILLAGGCATEQVSSAKGIYADRKMFARGEIKLPANYNKDNFRRLLMGVAVSVGVDPLSNAQLASINPAEGFTSRLQAEMGKLKRFSIYSAFNREGVYLYKSLEDIGEAAVAEPDELQQIDLLLNLQFILCLDQDGQDDNREYTFSCNVTANCEDLKTHTVKFSTKATGAVTRFEKTTSRNRRVLTFNGVTASSLSASEIRSAYMHAALKAISNIVSKIGNYYPVGGRIVGVLGNRMTLDRGFEQGIENNMQMAIYTTVNGVDVPLGVAEASPADQTTNLQVWRWNTGDPLARPIIRQIQRDPQWLDKNECYAVSLRLAVPPEWDWD